MVYNILDFGAASDGVTLCTAAIQAAIDECHKNGGGRVLIPAGDFYSGSFYMRDNVELHLEFGSKLIASANIDDYNPDDAYPQNWGCDDEEWRAKHLIMAIECKNVAITGYGLIDGNGESYRNPPTPPTAVEYYVWMKGKSHVKDMSIMRPGQLICFIECKNVTVEGIRIENAPCWCVYLYGCEYVRVTGITVDNHETALNTDGIDIDCSRYVTVSDCNIETGDDAIAIRCSSERLKKYRACEYVTVTGCNFAASACAFRIGVGIGEIKHVRISNITIERAGPAIKYMTSYMGHGEAHIEDVHFSDISIAHCARPIEIVGDRGSIKRVSIKNLTANGIAAILIDPTSMCESTDESTLRAGCDMSDITLRNISYHVLLENREITDAHKLVRGNNMLYIGDARGVVLDGVKVSCDEAVRPLWDSTSRFTNPDEVTLINCKLD